MPDMRVGHGASLATAATSKGEGKSLRGREGEGAHLPTQLVTV